jgi:hypothetical protein
MAKINIHHPRYNYLSEEAIKKIEELYSEEQIILKNMIKEEDRDKLLMLADDWHSIQFKLQKQWGFKQDINYHKWWNLPKCRCPKMDNDDAWPTGHYVRIEDCPLHGKHTWIDYNDAA